MRKFRDIWEPRRLKFAKIEGLLKKVVGKGTEFFCKSSFRYVAVSAQIGW